jgi:hypothetical protein
MPEQYEDQPWYLEWRAAVDRVGTAHTARDSAATGSPERQAADLEYDDALIAFRSAAQRFR